jgi:uncharacterized protein YjbI with pentapeptide repeats
MLGWSWLRIHSIDTATRYALFASLSATCAITGGAILLFSGSASPLFLYMSAGVSVAGAFGFLWFTPKLQSSLVPGLADAKLMFEVENDARQTLAAVLAGSLFMVTGYFTWLQFQATQRRDYSERFVKATEMLASGSSPTTRLAGAAILRSLAEAGESPTESEEIVRFLDLFIRTNATKRSNTTAWYLQISEKPKPAPEIQEILDLYRGGAYRRVRKVAPADLRDSDLGGAVFVQGRLNGARFYNAILRGSSFYEAELRAAEFAGADLRSIPEVGSQTILGCADLQNADFANAKLDGAAFGHADLRKAQFGNAGLKGVQFLDANISGADFRGADLEEADLSQVVCSQTANFESAKNRDKAKFPKTPSCPFSWALLPFCKPIG